MQRLAQRPASSLQGVLQTRPTASTTMPCRPRMPIAGCVDDEHSSSGDEEPPISLSTSPLPDQAFEVADHRAQKKVRPLMLTGAPVACPTMT